MGDSCSPDGSIPLASTAGVVNYALSSLVSRASGGVSGGRESDRMVRVDTG